MEKLIATIRQALIEALAEFLNKWYNRLNKNPETLDTPNEDLTE
jgi:hypothetical protein